MPSPGTRLLAVLAGVALLGAVAACDPGGEEEPATEATSTTESPDEPSTEPSTDPTTEPSTDPTTEPGPTDGGGTPGTDDPRAAAAVEDLAERLDLQTDQIIVGTVEEVTWTDGSIGCPEPGEQYTQALVPGARVILTVTGTEYAYHARGDEPFFYCAEPTDPAPAETA